MVPLVNPVTAPLMVKPLSPPLTGAEMTSGDVGLTKIWQPTMPLQFFEVTLADGAKNSQYCTPGVPFQLTVMLLSPASAVTLVGGGADEPTNFDRGQQSGLKRHLFWVCRNWEPCCL